MTGLRFDLQRTGSIVDAQRGSGWTADDLRRAVAAKAEGLKTAGIGSGSAVVVAHGGTPAFFADLFAVWAVGGVAACVNPASTAGEIHNVATFVAAKAILAPPERSDLRVPGGCAVLDAGAEPGGTRPDAIVLGRDPDADALMLFTSGTTGTPRAVLHRFRSLQARIALNHRCIDARVMARSLCVLATHFGHGLIGNCLTPLFCGGDVVLAPGGLQGAARLGALVDEFDVRFMSSVPAFWKLALKTSAPPARETLRQIHVGSAPVASELVAQIARWSGADDVRNMYGITETANWIAGGSARERPPEDGLVGPMWGGEAAVVEEDGTRRAHGSGEIVVKTPSLMAGYYRRPDLTAEAVRDGWYHTGDSGVVDDRGWIRLIGRRKNEINRAGAKVSPEELDLLFERHPAVLEACAFGLPDEAAGETVALAVRLAPGRTATSGELRAWAMDRIRRECVPEHWYFLADIPKTDRGKLNRALVRETCQRTQTS